MGKTQQPDSPLPTRDERVGLLAFQIWEEAGRPDGKSEEHWHLACAIIDGEAAGASSEVLPTWLNRRRGRQELISLDDAIRVATRESELAVSVPCAGTQGGHA